MGEGRQTLLFSATLPGALAEFARVGLKDPALVRLDVETRISPDLRLAFFTLRSAMLAPPPSPPPHLSPLPPPPPPPPRAHTHTNRGKGGGGTRCIQAAK